jgi:hypothetical protein
MICGMLSAATLSFAPAAPLFAAELPTLTESGVISGTMDIKFNTRTQLDKSSKLEKGSAKLGVKDEYIVNLNVGNTTEFTGTIQRQPELKVKLVGMEAQAGALLYDINLSVLNPRNLSQKKTVGKWVGGVPMDGETNVLDLSGGEDVANRLRMAVDTVGAAQGFTSNFSGKLVGQQAKGDDWKDKVVAFTFERVIGKKKVKIEAKQTDPVKFDNVVLAKGPSAIYPTTRVNGRMDYDYDTGNWYINGLSFKYNLDGTDYEDVLSGSVKWMEDANRAQNGKGWYEFNLRFNEDQHSAASTEADAFAEMSEEEAFFAVDNSIPTLTGRIDYVDTMIPGTETPSASKITYSLNANKLSKQQIMNFFKLWMLAVGPVNDE